MRFRLQAILKRCSSLLGEYRTPWFMGNPHVETIFAAKFRHSPDVEYKRELLTMADGGTVAVDWLQGEDVEVMRMPFAPSRHSVSVIGLRP